MGFKDLRVYQKAFENSIAIHELSLTFPQFEQYELGAQMRRATKSIVLNIAEGYGKNDSLVDFKRFLTMALGSNDEVLAQLDYCKELKYISYEEHVMYAAEYASIGKMLTTMLQKWKTFN